LPFFITMSLVQRAINDIKAITSNKSDWAVGITLVSPTAETITTTGLFTKHHLGVDTDGNIVNSKNTHISISEENLAGYPVRNLKGEVALRGHLATVKDSTGTSKTYKIEQSLPDETIGLIVMILGDYA
jgi:hypothetical protein